MSIWDSLKTHAKAQFLDVIQWMEDDASTIVWRFPIFNQAIQDGAKLVVREGQAALFVNEGQLSEVFGPGTYEIGTRTKSITSFFESIKYQLNYPYKGDIFFVSTRQFIDQKWGTPKPIMLNDKQLGPVRFRAFGNYSYRVTDPGSFLRELVGNRGLFTTDEIAGQVKLKMVSAFADTVGESGMPLLDLASQYMDLGEAMRDRMTGWFEENYGISITDFVVGDISLPEEVEKMLDKRTSMGLIGDMGAYSQFQSANAMETAAARPGGGANPMMDAGMGMAMGNVMGQQMMNPQMGRQYNPTQGMPGSVPPPPPGPALLHYNGASGQAQLSAADIAKRVAADRDGAHNVWAQGWPGWKSWKDVPEIVALLPPAAPPPPAAETYHYNGPDGQAQLSAQQIQQKLDADPTGRHLVWQAGWPGWKDAKDVPEITDAGGPPPLPGPPAPPPLP